MYLVLEYMGKGDLLTYIRNRDDRSESVPPSDNANTCQGGKRGNFKIMLNDVELWNIFRQVNSGVKYLHYQNIVHGDIKPQVCFDL